MSQLKSTITQEQLQKINAWLEKSLTQDSFDILEIKPLKGSTSSLIYNILCESKEGKEEFVLRLFNDKEWFESEPDLAYHEAEALSFAFENNLNSPKLLATDFTGEYCTYPAILMSKLPGEVILRPHNEEEWLDELACNLARIHKVEPQDFSFKYFTYNDVSSIQTPKWSINKEHWEKLIDFARKGAPEFKSRFIHRDYHPANILWKDNKVSGTVDWVNACIGPAAVDVGHARVNLAMLTGVASADRFLKFYQVHAGENFIYSPYWDIISLIDFEVGDLKLYPGWSNFGVNDLTDQIIKERIDEYAMALSAKI